MYPDPIVLATVSSDDEDKYMVYDENDSAGVVAISDVVGTLTEVQLSHIKSEVEKPSTKTDGSLKKMGASYPVYIDFKPAKDYVGGAYVQYSATNTFKLTGTCGSEPNTCVPSTDAAYKASCVNTTLDTGLCNKVTDTDTYVFEHKGALSKKLWYRIKVSVANPNLYTDATGGVSVMTYSRKAGLYYAYETKSLAD